MIASINGISLTHVEAYDIRKHFHAKVRLNNREIGSITFNFGYEENGIRYDFGIAQINIPDETNYKEYKERVYEYIMEHTNGVKNITPFHEGIFFMRIIELREAERRFRSQVKYEERIKSNKQIVALEFMRYKYYSNSMIYAILEKGLTTVCDINKIDEKIDACLEFAMNMPSNIAKFDVVYVYRDLQSLELKSQAYIDANTQTYEVIFLSERYNIPEYVNVEYL
jgi:hypothetical protein